MIVHIDKLGRIVLKKKLREKYGEQFILIDRGDEIVLKPNHLDMNDLSEKLKGYSFKKLKKIIEKEAMNEVEESLR